MHWVMCLFFCADSELSSVDSYARVITIMQEHHINITQVNPDYVPKVTDYEVVHKNNFVECICPQSERENLCSELQHYGVISAKILGTEEGN